MDESELMALGVQNLVFGPSQVDRKGRVVYDVDALVHVLANTLGCQLCSDSFNHVLCAD